MKTETNGKRILLKNLIFTYGKDDLIDMFDGVYTEFELDVFLQRVGSSNFDYSDISESLADYYLNLMKTSGFKKNKNNIKHLMSSTEINGQPLSILEEDMIFSFDKCDLYNSLIDSLGTEKFDEMQVDIEKSIYFEFVTHKLDLSFIYEQIQEYVDYEMKKLNC